MWSERLSQVLTPRRIAIAGMFVVLAMCLFPPWRTPIPGQGFSVDTGYDLLFSPPNQIAEVDLGRLIVQVLVVCVIAGVGVMLRRGHI